MRRFVRVQLDRPVEVDIVFEDNVLKGNVKDISLGGVAMSAMSSDLLVPGRNVGLVLNLPDSLSNLVVGVEVEATIVKVTGESAPFTCIIEVHSDKHSQQQIAHYINQRQVEIIRELKDINS